MTVQELQELLREFLGAIEQVMQSGEVLSDEFQGEIANTLGLLYSRIEQAEQQAPPEQPPPTEPPPISQNMEGVDLLWILAGGNEEAFVGYLRTFPDPQFNQLLRNPQLLQQTIDNLRSRFGEGINLEADGIPHGPLMSSNIYGFQYDPNSKTLKVRFNSGSVYSYQGVPQGVFKAFESGAVPAKTDGENQYGEWWRGKMPSAGAAFYELIRNGGYAYQRLS